MKSLIVLALTLTSLYTNAANATNGRAVIMQDAVDGSYCTAFAITPDGKMMTALHCLRNCLVTRGLAEQASNIALGLNDLMVVQNQTPVNLICTNLSIPTLGVAQVQVLATGSALSIFDAKFLNQFSGLYAELKANGWASKSNDYAVIQVAANTSCLRLSAQAAAAGDSLTAIGYPLPAQNNATPVLTKTPGRVYGSADESAYYRAQKTQDERTLVKAVYGEPGVIYSSAATQLGQSGGPVLGRDNKVVGIVSGFTTTGNTRELTASSMAKVLANIPQGLARQIQATNARCE
jgi:hypothetical protein